jgi:predicted phage terminase large subunit-like protein
MTVLEKFRDNIILFGKTITKNTFSVRSPEMHYKIAAELQDTSVSRLNIIAPRGFAKTSLIGLVFVLWHCFVQKLPEGKVPVVVLISKTRGHSLKMLQSIKDILNFSMPFRELFGYHGEQNAMKWTEDEITLDSGVTIFAKGTGTQIVGLKHMNQRPTLIVLDDPEDMNNTKTDEAMEFNLRWLLQSLYPSRDPQIGRMIVIGTPQHQRCIVETLKQMPRWKTLHFQAIEDMGGPNERSAWEDWRPLADLVAERDEMESVGRVDIFYREMQCQIVGGSAQLFKPSYIRYYDGFVTHDRRKNQSFLTLNERNGEKYNGLVIPVHVYMGIDPASSTRSGADPSVIFPIAVDKDDNDYCLPYFRGRVAPMDFVEKVIQWYDTYRPNNTSIEATGYQEMLRDNLRRQRFIPGLEVKYMPRDKKSTRLESLQPRFAQGKVYLLRNMTEYTNELITYPKGKHDDLIDGHWYARRRARPAIHEIEKKEDLTDHLKYYAGLAEALYPWEKRRLQKEHEEVD